MSEPIPELEPINAAVALLGARAIATACEVSVQAVYKWVEKGRLPRTDYTGETNYAGLIAAACLEKDPHTTITRDQLLGDRPGRVQELEADLLLLRQKRVTA